MSVISVVWRGPANCRSGRGYRYIQSGSAVFNQTIRAAFSDNRVSRRCSESVNCTNRESDAEKGLAFHGNDGRCAIPPVSVMVRSSDGHGDDDDGFYTG